MPEVGDAHPVSVVSVQLAGCVRAMGLSSPKMAPIQALAVSAAAGKTQVGGFSVWLSSSANCFEADDPARDMPVTYRTVSPPPVSPVIVAVKVVEVAEPTLLLRIQMSSIPVVPPPRARAMRVYAPRPSELLSATEMLSPPAIPDAAATTTIRSFRAGVATTVLSPAVVFQVSPSSLTVAMPVSLQ